FRRVLFRSVWFYRVLAGMNTDLDQPGYRHIIFKPQPAGDVTHTAYSNMTPYGTAGIEWKITDRGFTMDIEVPVGSTATVYVPAGKASDVTETGGRPGDKTVTFKKFENGYAVYTVGSGKYNFISKS